MSRIVKMTLALNTATELKLCEDIEERLNLFPKEYKFYFKDEIGKISNSIQELKEFAKNIDGLSGGDKKILEYQKLQDSITKKIKNISTLTLTNFIEKVNKIRGAEIREILINNGIIGTLAMQELENASIEITTETLFEKINEIRNNAVEESQKKKLIEQVEDDIFDSEFPLAIEEHLLNLISNSNSPQMIADLLAIIEATKNELNRINSLYTNISKTLVNLGFKEINQDYKILSDGEAYKEVVYRNKIKKEIKIKFKARGIDYKMGNYEGHLCEKDSENFHVQLQKTYNISDIRIIRNQSNSKPMLRKLKQRERSV